MSGQGGPGGGADSGVETECELESNDSCSDNSNMAAPSLPGPASPPCAPVASGSSSHCLQEDGYLGDCSSDGGNEKNFPLPPDWSLACARVSLPPSPVQSDTPSSPNTESELEPPAGLQFSNVASEAGAGSGLGYHILAASDWTPGGQSALKSKMRHGIGATGFRSKYSASVGEDWAKVKRTIAERKLRSAANTNNSDQAEQLCAGSGLDVNSCDEHKRSALHFAAAKASVGMDSVSVGLYCMFDVPGLL